jgi:DNA-binding GntR family transcriptional regulator
MVKRRLALRDRVRAVLEERLVTGELPAGQRLREEELSQELGVSRTPLREALLELERLGLVESQLARGFTVVPLRLRECRELYPVVAALEALALSTVNPQLLALDLGRMEAQSDRMLKATTVRERVDADIAFHDTLTGTCGNKHLLQVLHGQKLLLRRYLYHYMRNLTDMAPSVTEHMAVIAALRERNLPRAAELLRQHWHAGWERLLAASESRAAGEAPA